MAVAWSWQNSAIHLPVPFKLLLPPADNKSIFLRNQMYSLWVDVYRGRLVGWQIPHSLLFNFQGIRASPVASLPARSCTRIVSCIGTRCWGSDGME